MYAQDSIDLLTRSGINFKAHAERGIDVGKFGELLTSSGLVLTSDVKWLSFHAGCACVAVGVGPVLCRRGGVCVCARLRLWVCLRLCAWCVRACAASLWRADGFGIAPGCAS